MTQGMEKVWELAGSKGGIQVEVAVQEQYDILTNTSCLTVGVRVKSSQYYQYTYYLKGSVAVDGEKIVTMSSAAPTHYVLLRSKNTYYTVKNQSSAYTASPWTRDVVHNTDGSKAVTLSVSLKGYTSGGGGGSGWSVSAELPVTLTQIPRASLIAATDATVGSVSMIAVTRRSAEYSHSLQWAFGDLSGWLGEDGSLLETEEKLTATAVPFRLPEGFYGQIPASPTGVCSLICRTYLGDTQVGDAQQTAFTVTADPALCGPVVTATVTDCNPDTVALTGNSGILVRGVSNALCTLTAQARGGAAITQKTVAGRTIPEDTLVLEGVQEGTILFAAADSRGYTAAAPVTLPVVDYRTPTVHMTAARTEPASDQVAVTVSGSWFAGSFGAQENALTLSVAADGGEPVLLTAPVDPDYQLQTILEGLDYRQSHTVTVTAADALCTVTRTVTVGKGVPVFDWGENDFAFHVPVTAPSINGFQSLALAAYPVGSLYLTLNEESPETLFGGRWEKIRDRFLLAAGEDYPVGTTGGAAAHTLTVEEMPEHTHELPAVASRVSGTWDGTVGSANCAGKQDCRGIQKTGGGAPHNNMPPYLAVHVWKRIQEVTQ